MSNTQVIANYASLFGFSLGFSFNPAQLQREALISPELMALLQATGQLAEAWGNFNGALAAFNGGRQSEAACHCAPVSPPTPEDGCHPAGSLRTEGSVITTPGGYRIEMLGQYEWQITGPDGKSTRIWGDPHVDEGDRAGSNDWEFKRNSTFVLPDGTHINVTTVPTGNGMTVTGQLEVINGVDRVLVTDIDKGKGNIGTVTQDGHLFLDKFKGDVIRMGREADDWSFEGREITGSKNGGETLETGGELVPGSASQTRYEDGLEWATSLFNDVINQWQDNWRPNSYGFNPYSDQERPAWERDGAQRYDRGRHQRTMAEAFRALGVMLSTVGLLMSLSAQLSAGRRRQTFSA